MTHGTPPPPPGLTATEGTGRYETCPRADATLTVCAPDDGHGPLDLALAVESPGAAARRLRLPRGGSLVLGSGDDADVRIVDATVSRAHCRVTHAGSFAFVEDLGSRNGVRLDGARVPSAPIGPGVAVVLGRTVVRVEQDAAAPAPSPKPLPGLIGGSSAMLALAAAVRRVARLRLPVLVRGETGTGKDLVAKALHAESARAGRPFVAINAAAIARELCESELFGHQRGAFTGAVRDRKGAFREADGGTLFLDEIAALPLDLQAKLLRAVEEGVVRPLGAEAPVAVDVRLVAATCEPLETMIEERRFRADLYERLAVCVLTAPPLRARPEDVGPLAAHLLAASELAGRRLSRGAIAALRSHRWPGNVRELRNVVVQAALRGGDRVEAADVEAVLAERASLPRRRLTPTDALRVFEDVGGNVSAAARRASVPRSTMRDLLRAAGAAR
jgi:DNA-binding NtrC family response regulator